MVKIAPSILSADFTRLGESIAQVEDASDLIHVDVMDGHFVPNLTIGPAVVAALSEVTSLPLDCHLMITDPGAYLEDFSAAGAASCTVHIEAVPDPSAIFGRCDELGLGRGLALNPNTQLCLAEPFLDLVDLVVIMTVQPGFAAQQFRSDVLPKIEQCAKYLRAHDLSAEVEVDGGVSPDTVRSVVDAGGTVLVAGSAIFGANDPGLAANLLRRAAVGFPPTVNLVGD